MRLRRWTSLTIIGFALILAAGRMLAQEHGVQPEHPAQPQAVTEGAPEHDTGSSEGHGGATAEDHSVLGVLTHHLMDSQHYKFLFWDIHLPNIQIGGYTLPVTKHTVMLVTAAILLIVLLMPLRRLRGGIPHGMGNFLEVLIVFIRDEVIYPNLGEKDGRKYLPYFLTIFFFILFSNLLGMIPYGSTPTGNISVTGGLAAISLLVMIGSGIARWGMFGYLGSFVPHGVPLFVAPILFPIEIIGVLVKHFALCIRLFANMLAGHAVISVFLALISSFAIAPVSILGAVAISMLELFVAVLQAYIFTMLSSLFLGGALHPEH
jgi:F-type H+-transporting ATPase subunit a